MPPAFGFCPDTAPLTVELAVRFVRRESAALVAALRATGDRSWVDEALRWHDEAHRAWLALLAVSQRAGWSCEPALDRLYRIHGRLAELFERGCPLGGSLRELLAAHLQEVTDDTVAALRAEAAAAGAVATSAPTRPAPAAGGTGAGPR